MKKYILIAFLFALSKMSFAQTLDSTIVKLKTPKNELALNIGDFLISNRIGFVYERFLHKKHSVLFHFVGFDKIPNVQATPFLFEKTVSYGLAYRFYRAKNKANSGFFISPMARIRQSFDTPTYKIIDKNTFVLSKGVRYLWSAGLGLGAKITQKRLTFTLQTNLFYNFIPYKVYSSIPNRANESDVYYLTEISEPKPIGFGFFAGFGYRF